MLEWAGLVSIGVKTVMAEGVDYVLTFNDDNIATAGFLRELRDVADKHPAAIVASVCCYSVTRIASSLPAESGIDGPTGITISTWIQTSERWKPACERWIFCMGCPR